MRIFDISQEVLGCRVFKGDPTPKSEKVFSIENGDLYNLSTISMCVHNGTHVDAPAHFISGGKTVSDFELDRFVGDCYVARTDGFISASEAQEIFRKAQSLGACEKILIAGAATVTAEAAKAFRDAGVRLLGNESQSVGPIDAPMEVHLILLEADVILLEGLNLIGVDEGRYFLSAAPLNISGTEGAPCRAYLIKD